MLKRIQKRISVLECHIIVIRHFVEFLDTKILFLWRYHWMLKPDNEELNLINRSNERLLWADCIMARRAGQEWVYRLSGEERTFLGRNNLLIIFSQHRGSRVWTPSNLLVSINKIFSPKWWEASPCLGLTSCRRCPPGCCCCPPAESWPRPWPPGPCRDLLHLPRQTWGPGNIWRSLLYHRHRWCRTRTDNTETASRGSPALGCSVPTEIVIISPALQPPTGGQAGPATPGRFRESPEPLHCSLVLWNHLSCLLYQVFHPIKSEVSLYSGFFLVF